MIHLDTYKLFEKKSSIKIYCDMDDVLTDFNRT